jgi:hypothetical protein
MRVDEMTTAILDYTRPSITSLNADNLSQICHWTALSSFCFQARRNEAEESHRNKSHP